MVAPSSYGASSCYGARTTSDFYPPVNLHSASGFNPPVTLHPASGFNPGDYVDSTDVLMQVANLILHMVLMQVATSILHSGFNPGDYVDSTDGSNASGHIRSYIWF